MSAAKKAALSAFHAQLDALFDSWREDADEYLSALSQPDGTARQVSTAEFRDAVSTFATRASGPEVGGDGTTYVGFAAGQGQTTAVDEAVDRDMGRVLFLWHRLNLQSEGEN